MTRGHSGFSRRTNANTHELVLVTPHRYNDHRRGFIPGASDRARTHAPSPLAPAICPPCSRPRRALRARATA